MSGELARILAVAGGIDDDVLGGWPAVMIGYPAAVTVAAGVRDDDPGQQTDPGLGTG